MTARCIPQKGSSKIQPKTCGNPNVTKRKINATASTGNESDITARPRKSLQQKTRIRAQTGNRDDTLNHHAETEISQIFNGTLSPLNHQRYHQRHLLAASLPDYVSFHNFLNAPARFNRIQINRISGDYQANHPILRACIFQMQSKLQHFPL